MNKDEYKVLITVSGTGSRLGDLTKNTNKALVKINDVEAIDYLIRKYPEDVTIVFTLGYLGEQVKNFLLVKYPKRKFEFAVVDKYEGPGSSLGYSMLCAKEYLQCPFIFHACDTIVLENIPKPDINWVAGFIANKRDTKLELKQYRTHKVINNKIIKLNDKGIEDFESVHIGLVGIKDFSIFWKTLAGLYAGDSSNTGWSDVHVLDSMIKQGIKFDLVPYKVWLDTGTPVALELTKNYIKETENDKRSK